MQVLEASFIGFEFGGHTCWPQVRMQSEACRYLGKDLGSTNVRRVVVADLGTEGHPCYCFPQDP